MQENVYSCIKGERKMYFNFKNGVKRKVFISYYHGDQGDVDKFVRDFGDVFIPKTVGVKDGDFDFDSNSAEYIMRKIREQKLSDSTVTIVLVGSCTHSRRYVDWEVKASLQQGQTLPNGLIAINLPYMGTRGNLPQRVSDNVIRDSSNNDIGYARYYPYPLDHHPRRQAPHAPLHAAPRLQCRIDHLEGNHLGQLAQVTGGEHVRRRRAHGTITHSRPCLRERISLGGPTHSYKACAHHRTDTPPTHLLTPHPNP